MLRVARLVPVLAMLMGCTGEDGPDGQPGGASPSEDVATSDETDAPATAWTVELILDEGDPADTITWALSPFAAVPESLADAGYGFRNKLVYTCPEAYDRQIGNVRPITIVFWRPPRLVAPEEVRANGGFAIDIQSTWGIEEVVLRGHLVPRRSLIYLEQDYAAMRESGRNAEFLRLFREAGIDAPQLTEMGDGSHEEFLRRLLRSGEHGPDEVSLVLDWEGLGAVRFTYSLEGATDAVREAGRPCGVE